MAKLVSIAAQPDAPVACDMTAAEDSLTERLAEYRRLFDLALLGRDSTATSTTLRFAAHPGVSSWVLDLIRREAACCPFLSYELDLDGEEVVWTISGGVSAFEMAVLEEFLTGDKSGSSSTVARQLTDRGGVPILVPDGPT